LTPTAIELVTWRVRGSICSSTPLSSISQTEPSPARMNPTLGPAGTSPTSRPDCASMNATDPGWIAPGPAAAFGYPGISAPATVAAAATNPATDSSAKRRQPGRRGLPGGIFLGRPVPADSFQAGPAGRSLGS
jgi:hypothetical protein